MPMTATNNQYSLPSILDNALRACPQGAQYWFGLLSTYVARAERQGVDAMVRVLEQTSAALIPRHGASHAQINDARKRVAAAINAYAEAKERLSAKASSESAQAAPIERNLGQRRRSRTVRPFVSTL